jgi:hypothetical protein
MPEACHSRESEAVRLTSRHTDVGDESDQGFLTAMEVVQGTMRVGLDRDLKPGASEDLLSAKAKSFVVIDEKNARRSARHAVILSLWSDLPNPSVHTMQSAHLFEAAFGMLGAELSC